MKITTQLSVRYLKQNRRRTLITIFGAILATLLLTCVTSMVTSAQHSLANYIISQTGNWDARFINVTYENASAITDNSQVKTSMISHEAGFAQLKNPQNSYKPYVYLAAYDPDMLNNYPLTLISGRLPQNPDEIVIANGLCNEQNYTVGQKISLSVGERTLSNGSIVQSSAPIVQKEILTNTKRMTFTVVGIIEQPGFISRMTPGYTVITYLDKQSLSASDVVNISILAKNPKQIYNIAPQLAASAKLGSVHPGYNKDLLGVMGIDSNDIFNSVLYTIEAILLLIIFIGAVTLIYNSFAISISERSRQFGILSSIGCTPRQLRKIVLFEGGLIGLIAVPIGIILGLCGFTAMLSIIQPLLSHLMVTGGGALHLSLYILPVWIMISALSGVFTVFISALIPIFRMRKISAMDAIRQNKEIEMNENKLKISPIIKKLYGFEGFLAMKNFKRNAKRYRTIVISLSVSIILFIAMSSAVFYMTKSAKLSTGSLNYNVSVTLLGMDKGTENFINSVTSMNTVKDYSVLRENNGNVEFDTSNIAAPLKNVDGFGSAQKLYIYTIGDTKLKSILSGMGIDFSKYTDTNNPTGLLINSGVFRTGNGMEIYSDVFTDLPKSITIKGDKGEMPLSIGNSINYSPTGVNKILQPGLQLIVSDEVFDSVQYKALSGNESPYYQVCIMSNNVNETVQSINQSLKDFDVRAVNVADINSVFDNKSNVLMILQIFVFGFIALISLIGISNVVNTVSTGVALRRKELAMLKSVGITPKSFSKMVNFESLFYGVKALLYGLPIGLVLSYLIYFNFNRQFVFGFTLPWVSIVICIFGVFIVVFGTMIYSNRKINKENIVDALRSDIS